MQQAQQQPSQGEQALSDLQKMIQLQQQLLDRSFQMDRQQRQGGQQGQQQQGQQQQGQQQQGSRQQGSRASRRRWASRRPSRRRCAGRWAS